MDLLMVMAAASCSVSDDAVIQICTCSFFPEFLSVFAMVLIGGMGGLTVSLSSCGSLRDPAPSLHSLFLCLWCVEIYQSERGSKCCPPSPHHHHHHSFILYPQTSLKADSFWKWHSYYLHRGDEGGWRHTPASHKASSLSATHSGPIWSILKLCQVFHKHQFHSSTN